MFKWLLGLKGYIIANHMGVDLDNIPKANISRIWFFFKNLEKCVFIITPKKIRP